MNRSRTSIQTLSFFLALAGLVMLLAVLNWIPGAVRKDTLREYVSLEEVRSSLTMRDIFIPSYFPQNISWPPARILAQASPFPALVMEFKQVGRDEILLVLSQSSGGTLDARHPVELAAIREQVSFVMRGNNAVLTVGECGSQEPCSRIAWTEGGYSLSAVMRAAPYDLSRIAASMHP